MEIRNTASGPLYPALLLEVPVLPSNEIIELQLRRFGGDFSEGRGFIEIEFIGG